MYMYINLFDIFQQKLNILIKITSGPCRNGTMVTESNANS